MYEVPGYAGGDTPFSLECILHDKEGDKIHASAKRELIDTIRPLLGEGKMFAIRNFVVTNNHMRYKTTSNKYKIIFQARTKIVEMFDITFPTFTYNFQKFSDVANTDNLDERRLIDVIGKVVSVSPTNTRDLKGGPTKQMDITLQDNEGTHLPCTLWGNFPNLLNDYVTSCGSEAVVVILQMFRQKIYRDQVNLSNTFYISRLICDKTDPEIVQFKSNMPAEREGNIICTVPNTEVAVINKEFEEGGALVRTIDQLKHNNELGSFWIYAEIVEIMSTNEWWYLSCSKCRKKLEPCAETYYCEKCDAFEKDGKIRYKVVVKVMDGSDEVELVMWDNEVYTLTTKAAGDIYKEASELRIETMPDEIAQLIGKQALFKVQVRANQLHNHNGPYTVMKLSTDDDLISHYAIPLIDDEVFALYNNLVGEVDKIEQAAMQDDNYDVLNPYGVYDGDATDEPIQNFQPLKSEGSVKINKDNKELQEASTSKEAHTSKK